MEHSFEEIRGFIDFADTISQGAKERLRGEVSHGLNLVYMAHDQATGAKNSVDQAETALYNEKGA